MVLQVYVDDSGAKGQPSPMVFGGLLNACGVLAGVHRMSIGTDKWLADLAQESPRESLRLPWPGHNLSDLGGVAGAVRTVH